MAWSLFPTKRPTFSKTTLDILLLLGLLFLFYGNPLLSPRSVSYGGDGLSLFLPAVTHYTRSMYLGFIPLWNSYTWLGAPFLATYQAGVLYPPLALSLFFSAPSAGMNFLIFFSLVWLACGSYFFGVRALELERSPSLLMAIAMGCSGFVGAHTDHVNQLAAISWIPWIMSEALLLLRHPRVRHLTLFSLCLGMQILAGHPQYVIYTLVYLLGLASIYYVYYHHRRKTSEPPSWIGIVLLGVGILAGVALASAQLLPTAELSKRSLRRLDSPERMFSYSFPPRNLITMLVPFAYGNPVNGLHDVDGRPLLDGSVLPDGTPVTSATSESAKRKLLGMFENEKWVDDAGIGTELGAFNYHEWVCYIGVVTVALTVLALILMAREFIVRCFFFLALLILVLAAGSYVPIETPPYQLVMMLFPGGEHLRVPARFLIFFNLSVVVLAAVGFNQVMHYLSERRRLRPSTLAPLRLLILVIVFADLYLFSQYQTFRYAGTTAILQEKGPALQFFQENPGDYRVFRQLVEIPYDTDGKRIYEFQNRKRYHTRLQIQRFQPNLNMLYHIQTDKGYEEGLLPTLSAWNFEGKFRRNLRSPTPDTILMGLMNIKYVVTDTWYSPVTQGHLRPISRHVTPDFRDLAEPAVSIGPPLDFRRVSEELWPTHLENRELFFALYENLDHCPKFVWGERLENLFDLSALEVLETDLDPANDPLERSRPEMGYRLPGLGKDPAAPPGNTLSRLLGENYHFNAQRAAGSPNAYTLEKPVEDSGRIIMLESAYPGWVCRWDGHRVPLERINAVMMGCEVPKGVSSFRFAFEPFSFRLGLFISCCCVLLLSASVFFFDLPRRRSRQRKS